jgi:hypothetical protein
MIRRFSEREVLPALPREVREQLLSLPPAERRFLLTPTNASARPRSGTPTGNRER